MFIVLLCFKNIDISQNQKKYLALLLLAEAFHMCVYIFIFVLKIVLLANEYSDGQD